MVIIVEAGAVAEASVASKTVIQTTFQPFFFSTESLKNSPVEKAMKAKAISDKKSVPSMIRWGTRFRP